MTPTESKLQQIVAAKLKVKPEQVPLDKSFIEDIGLDSFDLMSIIIEIEEVFPHISLAADEAQALKTLKEVAAYIDHQKRLPSS